MSATRALRLLIPAISLVVSSAFVAVTYSSASAVGTVIFSEDFSSFANGGGATDVGAQASTGLTLGSSHNLTGWVKSGLNSVHGVDLDTSAAENWAASFYDDNTITMSTGVTANTNGNTYTVSFDLGPSVYSITSQATRQADGMTVTVLRADGTTLATSTQLAGVWDWSTRAQTLTRRSFTYIGDGTGAVKLKFSTYVPGGSRFGGAIDNVEIRSGAECAPQSITDAGATVLSFTTIGTCTWVVPAGVSSVRSLVVAGGGGGGGGGGGAGGFVATTATSVTAGNSITITVGNGGAGANKTGSGVLAGADGGNSSFGSITANGGGGGGAVQSAGRTGGSSGGAGQDTTSAATASTQGFSGGAGRSSAAGTGASGGGGAGAVGIWGHVISEFPDQRTMGGNGGAGLTSAITGVTVGYAGGGGGGANNNASPTTDRGFGGGGANNIYGAGDGSYSNAGTGMSATANSGSGGGGGDWEGGGGNGASGIVVLRFTAVAPTTTTPPTTTTTSTTTTTTTTTVPVATTNTTVAAPVTTAPVGQSAIATIAPTSVLTTAAPGGLSTQKNAVLPGVDSTSTTTSVFVKNGALIAPSASVVESGTSKYVVDGVTQDATVTRENNKLIVTAGSTTTQLQSLTNNGASMPLDSDGNLVLEKKGSVGISVLGFAPNTHVDVWIFSTPKKLGTTIVDGGGAANASLKLPSSLENGKHRIVMTGRNAAGKEITTTIGVVLNSETGSSRINVVAISLVIMFAIVGALFLPAAIRRRQADES